MCVIDFVCIMNRIDEGNCASIVSSAYYLVALHRGVRVFFTFSVHMRGTLLWTDSPISTCSIACILRCATRASLLMRGERSSESVASVFLSEAVDWHVFRGRGAHQTAVPGAKELDVTRIR